MVCPYRVGVWWDSEEMVGSCMTCKGNHVPKIVFDTNCFKESIPGDWRA